jgi:GNAT superfamily N-acetyltransferase
MSRKADIQIRRARADEMDAVRALTRAAYQPWVAKLAREPMPMSADYDAAFLDHRFDVIDADAGLAALIQTQPRGDSLWIENIAVAREFQGQGYGSALLDFARDLATQEGKTNLTLYTNKLMAKNIAIYKARGFVVTEEDPMPHGTVVYMALEL